MLSSKGTYTYIILLLVDVMLWLEHGHEVSMCYSVPKLEGFSPRDEGHYNMF